MSITLNKEVLIAQPVLVRNTLAGPTVFAVPAEGIDLRFSGAGDPNGGDVLAVNPTLLGNPDFTRNLISGTFVLESAPDAIMEAVEQQITAPGLRRSAQARAAQADAARAGLIDYQMDRHAEDEYVSVNCIGPGSRQGATCESLVAIKRPDLDTTPPLCGTHKSLARYTVPVEGELNPATGKPFTRWQIVSVHN